MFRAARRTTCRRRSGAGWPTDVNPSRRRSVHLLDGKYCCLLDYATCLGLKRQHDNAPMMRRPLGWMLMLLT